MRCGGRKQEGAGQPKGGNWSRHHVQAGCGGLLGLSPLMALGLDVSHSMSVLGPTSQFARADLRSWKSSCARLCFFLPHSFLHSAFTDHVLHVMLWARPWEYREENHSPSPSTGSLCNTEFPLSIQDGKARPGSGPWGRTGLTPVQLPGSPAPPHAQEPGSAVRDHFVLCPFRCHVARTRTLIFQIPLVLYRAMTSPASFLPFKNSSDLRNQHSSH